MMLAYWIEADYDKIDYLCAGINHQAFYLKFEENGVDLYPRIHKAVTENPEVYNEELVRNEMYLALGYYVTESSGHNSEYNWWFRKRPDLIEKYCTHGTGWNPGEYAYILREYQKTETSWRDDVRVELAKEVYGTDLERGQEYAAYIINALKGGEAFKFNGNVPNTQLVTNLPQGACVEVPVLADRSGIHPMHVGSLPAAVRAAGRAFERDRRAGDPGSADRRPNGHLPRHLHGPALGGGALAGGDPRNDQRAVRLPPAVLAGVQSSQGLGASRELNR